MSDKNTDPKYSNVRIQIHVRMESSDGSGVLDDGCWQLLKGIEKFQSLTQASNELGISYRKAWGDLRKAEQLLGFPLVEKHRGGSKGGVTVLTQAGIHFVKSYTEFHQEFTDSVKPIIIKLKRSLKEKPL
ncbi:MAG: LysR family transcriptional regulator [Bacteroidota bacterium]